MIAGNNNLTTDLASKWVAYWEAHHLFRSSPSAKKPYVMGMPLPNVTGMLHMGHVLNQTVQNMLVLGHGCQKNPMLLLRQGFSES